MQEKEKKKIKNSLTRAKECSTFTTWQGQVQHHDVQFWADLFFATFLKGDSTTNHDDDMLYFVNREYNYMKNPDEERFFVRRRSLPDTLPRKNHRSVHWEYSFFLNQLMHKFHFQLTVLVCFNEEEDTRKEYQVIKRVSKKVFASPTKVRMDKRERDTKIGQSFPKMYFSVEDFDNIWKDINLKKPGQFIAVDLCCSGEFFGYNMKNISIFRGGLGYRVSRRGFLEGKPQWYSGLLPNTLFSTRNKERFLEIKGPAGKGKVQIAFSRISDEQKKGEESVHTPSASSPGWKKLLTLTSIPQTQTQNEEIALNCSLCFVSIHWQSIIQDIFIKTERLLSD